MESVIVLDDECIMCNAVTFLYMNMVFVPDFEASIIELISACKCIFFTD